MNSFFTAVNSPLRTLKSPLPDPRCPFLCIARQKRGARTPFRGYPGYLYGPPLMLPSA